MGRASVLSRAVRSGCEAGGALLRSPGRREPGLCDPRERPAARQGRDLADPPRLRLGQPDLAPLAGCPRGTPRARTDWTGAADIPDNGGSESGFFHWGCGGLSDPSLCSFSISFRGTSSSDPDNDIATWSLTFGDGASASGDWGTKPPMGVTHTYLPGVYVVTLTVTDSGGQSASDAILMAFVDQTPD
jgi:hypothetical protein